MDDSEITQELPRTDSGSDGEITQDLPLPEITLELPAHLANDPILTMVAPIEDTRPLFDQLYPSARRCGVPVVSHRGRRRRLLRADKVLLGMGFLAILMVGGSFALVHGTDQPDKTRRMTGTSPEISLAPAPSDSSPTAGGSGHILHRPSVEPVVRIWPARTPVSVSPSSVPSVAPSSSLLKSPSPSADSSSPPAASPSVSASPSPSNSSSRTLPLPTFFKPH